MAYFCLLIASLVGIFGNVYSYIYMTKIQNTYCTKYTQTIAEYKACKASNLVEFIEKEGGK